MALFLILQHPALVGPWLINCCRYLSLAMMRSEWISFHGWILWHCWALRSHFISFHLDQPVSYFFLLLGSPSTRDRSLLSLRLLPLEPKNHENGKNYWGFKVKTQSKAEKKAKNAQDNFIFNDYKIFLGRSSTFLNISNSINQRQNQL